MNLEEELILTGFAPLLQIWGGICLLFFYLELLKRSPLKGRWNAVFKRFKECIYKLVTQFMALVSSTQKLVELANYHKQISTVDEYDSPIWERTRQSIYNLAKFGFFHVSIILLYIGFEEAYPALYPVLLIVSLIALVYLLLHCFFYGKGMIQKSWSVYLCVGLMLLAGVCFFFFPCFRDYVSGFGFSRTTVTLVTLLASTVAYFIALLFDYFRSIYTISKINSAIKSINSLFNLWANYLVLNTLPPGEQRIVRARVFFIRCILLFTEDALSFGGKTGDKQLLEYIRRRVDKLWPTLDKIREQFPPLPGSGSKSSANTP